MYLRLKEVFWLNFEVEQMCENTFFFKKQKSDTSHYKPPSLPFMLLSARHNKQQSNFVKSWRHTQFT